MDCYGYDSMEGAIEYSRVVFLDVSVKLQVSNSSKRDRPQDN